MLKRLFCCFLLLVLLPCAASAAFDPVAGHGLLNVPGLVFSSQSFDADAGILHLRIDTDETDWDQVVTSAYSAAGGEVSFSGEIPNPYGGNSDYLVISSHGSEDTLQDMVSADWWTGQGTGSCRWSWPLGSYDPDKHLFIPQNSGVNPYSVLVCFIPNDDSPEIIQRLRIHVTHESISAQPASLTLLPKDCITPDHSAKPEVDAGSVRYQRAVQPETTDPDQTKSVDTSVTLPDFQTGDYAVFRENGFDMGDQVTSDGSGLYTFGFNPGGGKPTVWQKAVTIEHYRPHENRSDALLAVYSLTITIVESDPDDAVRLFPEHVGRNPGDPSIQYFGKDQPDRLSLSMSSAVPGLSAEYAEGLLRFRMDAESFVPSAQEDLSGVKVHLTLTPPAGARYVGFSSAGGQVIYGASAAMYYSDWPQNGPDPVAAPLTEGYPFFREIPYENGASSYFTSPLDYTGEYSGLVSFYYWYDRYPDPNDPTVKPFLIEYIARAYDPATFETTTQIADDESKLPSGNEGKPFIIVQNKGSNNNHVFHAKMYPTGENRHYYELKVLNPSGREVPLDSSPCRLYLPYPPGYDASNAHMLAFTICHYNSTGSRREELYSVENGNLFLTEHGLCISVKDFSPFTVEWAEPASPALPSTGDHSLLLLWGMLLLLSCGMALCLRRRA